MSIATEDTANWLTAREALAQMARGALSSADLVAACLERIRRRDPVVRAWTYLVPAAAMAKAKAADAAGTGPLRGLPIGIKDIIYTHDMPTSFNSPHFRGHFPNIDAASVAILRDAGAVMMGKNDTVEFAVNGRRAATMNPHDRTRTPGGSSSGSAAAVADGQVPISLGTQTGGSVIRPASYCGTYAIKPTWNLVSHEGFKVCAASFDTLGWYARSAEDLDLIAEVFGIEAQPCPGSLDGARIAICKTLVWHMAEPATVAAMDQARAALEAAGAIVTDLQLPPEFDGLTEAHRVIMQAEMRSAFLADYRRLGDALYPQLVSIMRNAAGDSREDLRAAQNLSARCRCVFDDIAAPFDAVLTPSTSGEAPVGPEDTGAATFNRIWTLLHMPCVNVPGLTGPSQLPVGVTLTGPRYSDRRLISMAALLGPILSAARPKAAKQSSKGTALQ
ncbi:amidase [Tropicimonas isoalkanivorans]|uniref:Asp-tRNAAsn/Glu-tRNAGln amidotransferase A subunit n=1 Tax=Tropicimonas isoalkanivorans TaxID=441112 RepID=A0A1I1KX19_9RHOB|nr:amidase [Tropicimonas isoalkanivorans]SFC62683.1 Asp-tRNAAsn/Glu-tRNAGln amidotransferase A subunit [Tropicimonas isoalkanivorans]